MKERLNYRQLEDEIDIIELLSIYLKKWWLIAICGIIGAGIAFSYTHLAITPLYQASVSIYVNNVRGDQYIESISSTSLATSQKLVDTYVNIISSNTVLNKVIDEADLPYTASQMRSMLSSAQIDDTEIFRIYIKHKDPEEAANIANNIAIVAPSEIEKFVAGSSCKIIDTATAPTSPISPNIIKNTMFGGFVGVLFIVGILTLNHLLDTRIKDEEDLDSLFDIPILGHIPSFTQYDKEDLYTDNKNNISKEV